MKWRGSILVEGWKRLLGKSQTELRRGGGGGGEVRIKDVGRWGFDQESKYPS
jgi:hypothetical protein